MVLILGGIVTAGLMLAFVVVTLLFPRARQDHTLSGPLPAMPAPALQASPPQDMASFHARELVLLDGYGWSDRASGRIHIPIGQAIAEVARQGIPGWPTGPVPEPGGTTPATVPAEAIPAEERP